VIGITKDIRPHKIVNKSPLEIQVYTENGGYGDESMHMCGEKIVAQACKFTPGRMETIHENVTTT